MCACIFVVERCISRFNCQFTVSVHGISGIDGQVQKRILDLGWIDKGIPKSARDDGFDLDAFADRTA